MKKRIIVILMVMVYSLFAGTAFDDFDNFAGTIDDTNDEFIFWDNSDTGNQVKNLTGTALKAYIFGSAFSLAGKLTGGAYEIEGTNFDINGGAIDATTIGSGTASTGAFTTISASGAVTLSSTLSAGAGTFTYAGTAITSTGAELNILDGVTATYTELNLLDAGSNNAVYNLSDVLKFKTNTQVAFSMDPSAFYPNGSGIDLGKVGSQFEDLYLDGVAYLDSINIDGSIEQEVGHYFFNQLGGEYDVMLGTDTDTHAFFLDGSADRIGFWTSAPAVSAGIHLNGDIFIEGSIDGSEGFGCPVGEYDSGNYDVGTAYIKTYEAGLILVMNADTDNAGACTVNLNSMGEKHVKNADGADPAAGDIEGTGSVSIMIYDGTNFVLINPVNGH